MKFRKLFKSIMLWRRAIVARRQLKRLQLKLETSNKEHVTELRAVTKKYEYRLELERTRFQALHTEWANRFLQMQGRASLANATVTLKEQVDEIINYEDNGNNTENPEDYLTGPQKDLLADTKASFYSDGYMEGKEDSEIANFWDQMKPKIINDVRSQVR